MVGYKIINLSDMISELEEDRVKSMLLKYSCPYNDDIEYFLHTKAIEFSKQGLTRTHLVYTSYKAEKVMIGYFSLCNKYISVDKKALSKTLAKRISKFGLYDQRLKKQLISAPLIAQIGKNYTNGYNNLITGDELLKMACDYVREVQDVIGGKIVYLECEDIDKLKDFYSHNGFVEFGTRSLDKDETERLNGNYLVQMLKYL